LFTALLWLCVASSASAQTSAPECLAQILGIHASADAQAWEAVTLPDNWSRRHPDFAGDSVWYRIDWQRGCADSNAPVALLVQGISTAGEVFVNDHFLWRDENLTEPLSLSWGMPRYWALPDAWLHDGVSTIRVRAIVGGRALAGLGLVYLGESGQIYRQYEKQRWLQRTLIEIHIIISGVMGLLFFFIWIARREQVTYGWYAATSLFWVVFETLFLFTDPWPFPGVLAMLRVGVATLLLSIPCFCLFTLRFGGKTLPRIERALWGVTAVLLILLVLTPDARIGSVLDFSVIIVTVIFAINCLLFPLYALRTRQREHLLLAGCLLLLVAGAIHDLLVLSGLIPLSNVLLPYASIVNALGLAGILGMRHARNIRRIERFNHELADSVAEARIELAATLEREHALALDNVRMQDRLQIAHDLHDGLGGSLVHMMASVEQGASALQKPQVLSMLKLIRDDLRQTIDSNSSESIEVPATPKEWIAPLRHRFTNLFDELGIRSVWDYPEQWRAPPDALQCLALTRLVEEGLTNVIKHSRAREVSVRLSQPEANRLTLQLEDNGIGFDVAAVRQAGISIGMRSMATRIARVGGALEIESAPGRTVLTVNLHT
jgi:signal transduction histidine kinase